MNRAKSILYAKISTFLGGMLILSFGLFVIIIGFHIAHMINPIASAIATQTNNSQ